MKTHATVADLRLTPSGAELTRSWSGWEETQCQDFHASKQWEPALSWLTPQWTASCIAQAGCCELFIPRGAPGAPAVSFGDSGRAWEWMSKWHTAAPGNVFPLGFWSYQIVFWANHRIKTIDKHYYVSQVVLNSRPSCLCQPSAEIHRLDHDTWHYVSWKVHIV